MSKEIVIFGAGPAGLSAAGCLTSDYEVTVISPEKRPGDSHFRSIYSVSSKYLRLPEVFPPDLLRKLDFVRMIGDGFDHTFRQKGFMIDYPGVLGFLQSGLVAVHQEKLPQTDLGKVSFKETKGGVLVGLPAGEKEFNCVVNASGAGGELLAGQSRQEKNENPLVEYVFGGVFPGNIEPEAMILIFGPKGLNCWVNPSIAGKGLVDAVVSAWGRESDYQEFLERSKKYLSSLIQYLRNKSGIDINPDRVEAYFEGMIPSWPASRPRSGDPYKIGAAAGMGIPGSGDLFRFAVWGGRLLAEVIKVGASPGEFYGLWRKRLPENKLLLGATLAKLPSQRQGEGGAVVGRIISAMEKKGGKTLQEAGERFILEGKINQCIIQLILRNPEIQSLIGQALINLMAMRIRGEKALPSWSTLPEM